MSETRAIGNEIIDMISKFKVTQGVDGTITAQYAEQIRDLFQADVRSYFGMDPDTDPILAKAILDARNLNLVWTESLPTMQAAAIADEMGVVCRTIEDQDEVVKGLRTAIITVICECLVEILSEIYGKGLPDANPQEGC